MHKWYGHLSSLAVAWRQHQELQVSLISLPGLGERTSPPMRVFARSTGGGLKSNYSGLEPTQGEPLGCGPFSVPLLCRKVLLWHGIQHPLGALPHSELGEEQRPWGNGSPDMGGIPPTSKLLPRLLRRTKPRKEVSVTEARSLQQPFFKQRFGQCSACSWKQKGANHFYWSLTCILRILQADGLRVNWDDSIYNT